MPLYSKLIGSLGSAYGSHSLEAVLAELPAKKGLHKGGGYRASMTFKRKGIYLMFDWHRPDWVSTSAMLFPDGVDGFGGFAEPLEGSLPISSNRQVVRRTFGLPARSGGSGGSLGVLRDYFGTAMISRRTACASTTNLPKA